MLHDETERPVDMVKVFEGRLLICICAIPIPDDWKPLAGLDQVGAGANDQTDSLASTAS
jgi:hypothetical protein